ncbi:universal stress protein [Sphingopyxis sp.]|uniref:universal stress protein n=1 Tax=Sphingopyxis sp. TaxID=1908224 RepID=UPI001D5AD3EC|nr:universal stress protein [Sphingopyxis sp.]MBW8294475.1 universal stress protein [Sphingopyxis sp.]
MKSVLLHVQDDDGMESRLQTALSIVRSSNGHLSCLHVTPINAYVAFDNFGGTFVMNDIMKALEEQEARMRSKIEAHLTHEDVAWSYDQTTSDATHALVSHGALADIIIVGRSRHSQIAAYPALAMFGDLLKASRTPILVQPEGNKGLDPVGTAVVAWNGSFEAGNALRAALPLLQQASAVHIVAIDEAKDLDFPSLDASEYLSRHNISSEVISDSKGSYTVAEKLVATAQTLDASYLVMGAYGHSRAREYWFGGVTRSTLVECPVPLILSR